MTRLPGWPTKVYLVTSGEYSSKMNLGVFSSREGAEAAIKKFRKSKEHATFGLDLARDMDIETLSFDEWIKG